MSNLDAIDVSTRNVNDATILVPKGEIDLSRSPSLRDQIRQAQARKPRKLIIDLSHVPYMDSSGLATLIEAMKLAQRNGSRLILCALQDRVRSIFEIARLESVFTIVKSADEGLSA